MFQPARTAAPAATRRIPVEPGPVDVPVDPEDD